MIEPQKKISTTYPHIAGQGAAGAVRFPANRPFVV
jgi:hypothetical protein